MLPLIPIIIAAGATAALAVRTHKQNSEQRRQNKKYRKMSSWLQQEGFALTPDGSINPNAKRDDGTPCLIQAIKDGEQALAQELITLGADPNAMDAQGNTALFYVENLEILYALIEHGAVINAQNSDGNTPLHRAKSVEVVKILLEKGANPNLQDNDGKTPLHYAESVEVIKLLLANGADPNISDHQKRPPIFYARNHRQAFALMKYGARINLKDADNTPPILAGFIFGDAKTTIPTQAEYAPIPEHYNDTLNPELFYAVRQNNLSEARDLLERGANPNRVSDSQSILNCAKSPEMIQLLCSFHADVNQIIGYSTPPLTSSFITDKAEHCLNLIRYGAQINEESLHDCISHRASTCCLILLASGAEVTYGIWNHAVKAGCSKIIEYLEYFSDFKLTFDEAPTLELKKRIAEESGQILSECEKLDILKQIYKANNTLNNNLFEAVQQNDIEAVKIFLAQGANPDYQSGTDSCLTMACAKKMFEIVELLCASGADVNKTAYLNITPWNCASHSPQCREILRKYGAKEN